MGMDSFKIIIVEDVKLELKGTEEIIRTELPEAKIIGTAMNESEFWCLIKKGVPDLLLSLIPQHFDLTLFIST